MGRYRAGRGQTGHDGSSEHRRRESPGRVGLHPGEEVLIHRQGERRIRVPEAFADDLQRDPLFEQDRGVRMAQIVQPDRRKA